MCKQSFDRLLPGFHLFFRVQQRPFFSSVVLLPLPVLLPRVLLPRGQRLFPLRRFLLCRRHVPQQLFLFRFDGTRRLLQLHQLLPCRFFVPRQFRQRCPAFVLHLQQFLLQPLHLHQPIRGGRLLQRPRLLQL